MTYKKKTQITERSLVGTYELPLINTSNELLVDAKLLHQRLNVKTKFQDWFLRQVKNYRFEDGRDFFSNLRKSTGGRRSIDYHLTIDMAKELCMVERSEIGRRFRRYFIEAEKELRTKRLYAAQATLTEISKQVTRVVLNNRKMYDYRQVQLALGFSTKSSTSNVKRNYGGLLVNYNGRSFVAEEYVRVMMSRAKTRALTEEAKHAKPVLPPNWGQIQLNMKGGSHV